jgi:hypothetical protein
MPDACEQIQARMLEACRKIAADHGLIVESAGWRGLDPGLAFEPVFRVSIPASDGTAFNLEKTCLSFWPSGMDWSPLTLGESSAMVANNSGSLASTPTGHDTQSPPNAFLTDEDTNLLRKMSPCC